MLKHSLQYDIIIYKIMLIDCLLIKLINSIKVYVKFKTYIKELN